MNTLLHMPLVVGRPPVESWIEYPYLCQVELVSSLLLIQVVLYCIAFKQNLQRSILHLPCWIYKQHQLIDKGTQGGQGTYVQHEAKRGILYVR